MATPVTVIRGDGVGPEVIDAAVLVLSDSGADLRWEPAEAGAVANIKVGDSLPDETVRSIRRTGACLKGPLETPFGAGHRSANTRLRAELELYANFRPVRSYRGVETPFGDVDLAIVRENTEIDYGSIERYLDHDGDVVECASTTTRTGCERIVRYAFDYAARTSRQLVTLVHNATTMKLSSGLFLEAGREIAKHYRGIELEEMLVDGAAIELVTRPARFQVIVTPNLLGEVLCNLSAGLAGGLGLAPGMSVGAAAAVFEPIHGTAPEIARKGVANPTAAILAGSMMLSHIGEADSAERVETALRRVIAGRQCLTADLGGQASTREFAERVAGVVRTLRDESSSLR